ncbi:MAG: glycosyltransferase [Bacteroidota bacterium]|nr:glycosyltransferase [Bacteroidota bacterium]
MKETKKIRVVFVLPSLVAGGAERVISFVSQNLDKEIFDSTLLVMGNESGKSYDVSGINVLFLNKERVLHALPKTVSTLWKLRPDIVMSSIAHLNTAMVLISPLFPKTKFVGREATILSLRKKTKKRFYPKGLTKFAYKRLDALICQSQDMAKDMMENYGVTLDKVHVINNPISNYGDLKEPSNSDTLKLITVGRMTEVKGHQRLLVILSKIDLPFKYTIIGDGELKESIFSKAEALGVMKNIHHIPHTKEVNKYLVQNDYFLQGSYVEGFPNALLESCVVGTPVIAFDAPGGTKEIIEDGINGYMVTSEDEFIARLLEKKDWDPLKIRESVDQKFNTDRIIKQYEGLFQNLIQPKK